MSAWGWLPGPVRWAARPMVRAVRGVLRRSELRRALETLRGARGVRLVLLYHRVAPREEPRYEIVRTVPLHLFREQLEALGDLGRIVPLTDLLRSEDDGGEPLRVALTFDDDHATHARHVLPVLEDLDLHGTFFLSGRALHGLGGYWFERLETLVAERGLGAVQTLLDLPDVEEPRLPLHCEGDARRLALIERHAPPGKAPIDEEGIRTLRDAGMAIGFHTVEHPVLPSLDDRALREALTVGRDELGALAGRPLEWLSYPHGKTDDRTVRFAREAGYRFAWTTEPEVLRPTNDRHRLGRWEPQPLSTDEVLILLARVLGRGDGGRVE